jgi:purine-binding chemotaxis protein CheW
MRTVVDSTAATSRQLVVFSLAGEEYALPIVSVSEIIRHTPLRSVASDTPGVRGVIGLRGKIIPIIDLATRLGLPLTRADAGNGGKIVILDANGSQVGMCVDDVDEVLTVRSDQFEVVPTAGSAIEAIAKLDDRLVMLLDAANLQCKPTDQPN